jgi:hypothetical protein
LREWSYANMISICLSHSGAASGREPVSIPVGQIDGSG